jgi:3,4-dihydroxy 2-butanone 4-phosphate synthase/GTP cyclohydrolase II
MSALDDAVERFAAGGMVLVGGDRDGPTFVAAAADLVDRQALVRLSTLAGGMVMLALDDAIVGRLALPSAGPAVSLRGDMPFTASIDAVRGVAGGWSLRDRAHTMRIAVDPDTLPGDLAIPGHVQPLRVRGDDLLSGGGAAEATLELARAAGKRPAAVLSTVVDRDGATVSFADAAAHAALRRVPCASPAELRDVLRARRARELAVRCALPTRHGSFDAVAHAPLAGGGVMVALVHGDAARHPRPLVHSHSGCLFGEALGSLLCDCRQQLDAALAAIVGRGAGVVLYTKLPATAAPACGRDREVDAPTIAGVLRHAGVTRMALSGSDAVLAARLRRFGLDVTEAVAPAGAPE